MIKPSSTIRWFAKPNTRARRPAKPSLRPGPLYLPQIGGQWTKSKDEQTQNSLFPRLVPTDPNDLNSPVVIQQQAQIGSSEPERTSWGLQLNQSIFNWGQLVGLKQAGRVVAQADADYGVAQQDLALRVSTRYFDVLAAQDNVQAQQASLDAISRQLEQADKRFEVGLIAITDVQEARAARDTGRRRPDRLQAPARDGTGVPARDHRHAVRRAGHAALHHAAQDARAG